MHVLHILCVYNPLLHAFDQMTVTCAYFKTFKTSMVTFPSKSYDHDARPHMQVVPCKILVDFFMITILDETNHLKPWDTLDTGL